MDHSPQLGTFCVSDRKGTAHSTGAAPLRVGA